MQLRVKGRNLDVSDSIRAYAEKRLAKLERQLPNPEIELELAVEQNPSIREHHVAEATIRTKGSTIRARESSADLRASIDQLVDKLERQVTRYREKRHRHGRPRPSTSSEGGSMNERRSEEHRIVKTKQFTLKPMSPEEAVLQLELVGHDFFVFRNGETAELNVLYRRRDGDYGLIAPE